MKKLLIISAAAMVGIASAASEARSNACNLDSRTIANGSDAIAVFESRRFTAERSPSRNLDATPPGSFLLIR